MRPSSVRSIAAAAAFLTLLSCTGADFEQPAKTTARIETSSMQPIDSSSPAAGNLAAGNLGAGDGIAAKGHDSRLPQIDRVATTEFQTATFALG